MDFIVISYLINGKLPGILDLLVMCLVTIGTCKLLDLYLKKKGK